MGKSSAVISEYAMAYRPPLSPKQHRRVRRVRSDAPTLSSSAGRRAEIRSPTGGLPIGRGSAVTEKTVTRGCSAVHWPPTFARGTTQYL